MTDAIEQALMAKGFTQNPDGSFSRRKREEAKVPADAPDLESKLRDDIDQYCKNQWPHWVLIVARTDKRSTIAGGAHDITLFADRGRVFCFELKSRTGKLTIDQIGWSKRMELLGHKVKVIRSMSEFLEAVK